MKPLLLLSLAVNKLRCPSFMTAALKRILSKANKLSNKSKKDIKRLCKKSGKNRKEDKILETIKSLDNHTMEKQEVSTV